MRDGRPTLPAALQAAWMQCAECKYVLCPVCMLELFADPQHGPFAYSDDAFPKLLLHLQ
jgi:hypothetical protein